MLWRLLLTLCLFAIMSCNGSVAKADPPEHLVKANIALKEGRYKDAYAILHKAAKNGCVYSATLLGKMHKSGVGAKKSVFKAMQYFELAAEQDFGEAQYELGKMYYESMSRLRPAGLKARRWLALAAANGIEDARILLSKIPYEDRVEAQVVAFKKRASDAATQSQTGVVESYKGYADVVNTLNQATWH